MGERDMGEGEERIHGKWLTPFKQDAEINFLGLEVGWECAASAVAYFGTTVPARQGC
jgi:hypothetical protein